MATIYVLTTTCTIGSNSELVGISPAYLKAIECSDIQQIIAHNTGVINSPDYYNKSSARTHRQRRLGERIRWWEDNHEVIKISYKISSLRKNFFGLLSLWWICIRHRGSTPLVVEFLLNNFLYRK